MGFITVAGENQIATKQGAEQTLNMVSFVLANIDGLGAEPANRIEAMPAGGDIMATLPITKSGYVNTNQIVHSLVMDSSLGDYDFNWVGLIDDEGVLIAVTYTPLIQKRATAGAVPGNNLTRNFLIAFSGIQATSAIAVPAETWQIDFNARLHGIDERERLSNYDIYGHDAFLDDGWLVTREGATTTYHVNSGVGYVGGIRIATAVVQDVTVGSPPASIWVDVSLQGDISDVSAVVAFVIDAVAHPDYNDGNGFEHYLTKIADIAADGSVTDVRVLNETIADHEAKTDPHPQYLQKADTITKTAAEAGISTIVRAWSALRVKQAIAALGMQPLPLAALDYPTIDTADNRITITPAIGTNGGTVSFPANVLIALGEEISAGETGTMRSIKTAVYNSADLDINSTYFLRAKFVSGVFTVYTQKGTDADAMPGGLVGTVDGASGGGFDSTVLDVLFAKIETGAAGELPVVTALANHRQLMLQVDEQETFTSTSSGNLSWIFITTQNWARTPLVQSSHGVEFSAGNYIDRIYGIITVKERYSVSHHVQQSSEPSSTSVGTLFSNILLIA